MTLVVATGRVIRLLDLEEMESQLRAIFLVIMDMKDLMRVKAESIKQPLMQEKQ